MPAITERYADKIRGVLSCFDRVVIQGTLPDICHPKAIQGYLWDRKVRFFDYTKWAEPLRDKIRENAERLARENGLEIEYVRRDDFRKEKRVKQILAQRGEHPGLVHIFSAMERCPSFRPWYDTRTGKCLLRAREAKCLHYYFYFIDAELGLCYLRVPTWAPFRLQFYFNGHNAVALALDKQGIGYTLRDNAFLTVEDVPRAQRLADTIRVERLHKKLDRFAVTFCPVVGDFPSGYHWSLMQTEYATDVLFGRQADLQPLYEGITRTAVHAVKAEHVATFLGRKLHGRFEGEAGNDFHVRIEGTRIRHQMGPVAIKMYDKFGVVLRIETTSNDVSFFKHHRRVEHRDGSWEMKDAPMRKTIYSLPALRDLMAASNRRYLDFVSALDDPSEGLKNLERIARPVHEEERSYPGFNLFHGDDITLLTALLRGEFNISGFTNRRLRAVLPGLSGPQVSRLLKRLRVHGLIRKIGRAYKYYLTRLGRLVAITALKLREMLVIPVLAGAQLP
jgi:hypothetical protein